MKTRLRFASFLAPNMFPVYRFIADYVGDRLGIQTDLATGLSFDQFAAGTVDAGFICGLPYVRLTRQTPASVEAIAAPVLLGERYQGRPIYFSDVIVRRDRPFRSFVDLRGCTWSYNDPESQSGYGITRYWLVRMGETAGFFGKVVEAGFHQRSIRLVCSGEADASAIDSQVLAIELREHPDLASQLKVIDSLGPSTIQPVVAATSLPDTLKSDLAAALVEMEHDPAAREHLAWGCVASFARVDDRAYNDIREMLAAVEAEQFLVLK